MRVVIDTNILISALLSVSSPPARLIGLWRQGNFDLLFADEQMQELMRVTRYPKIRQRLSPALAGRLINEVRDLAVMVAPLPFVSISPDPFDNYLLAIASAGHADYVITGDKRDLLIFDVFDGAKIVTVRDFLAVC
jgi:uncharacterized protein